MDSEPTTNPDPDKEEGLNIAAASREKADPSLGREPVSLWAFLLCAVILLFAGSYLGTLSGGFDNTRFTALGYVPQPPPGMEGVEASKPWIDEYMALGRRRFGVCAGCHGSQGEGNPGQNNPPLAGAEWVTGETEILGLIILAGLEGPIEVKGRTYVNVMPSQAAGLSANDLGAVMTYVRRSFGNDASIVTPEMAQVALDLYNERLAAGKGAFTAAELKANHARMLPGSEVDPLTGKPPVEGGEEPGPESVEEV